MMRTRYSRALVERLKAADETGGYQKVGWLVRVVVTRCLISEPQFLKHTVVSHQSTGSRAGFDSQAHDSCVWPDGGGRQQCAIVWC